MKLKVEIFKDETAIPPAVRATLKTLQAYGYEAYLAGGCVRDALLGRTPKDFDIATNATPDQIEGLFEKTISVGREFGVMVVVQKSESGTSPIEVATFRNDGEYKDGRRPESIQFSSAEEDALRRDFTINGLFYDTKTKSLLDFVGGYEDLNIKIVRSIGSPQKRFTEDKLRILRAIRFSTELDFVLDIETRKCVIEMAPQLKVVSAERITEEINKMLAGSHPGEAFQAIESDGLSNIIFSKMLVFQSSRNFELLKFSLGLIEKESSLGWMLLAYFEWQSGSRIDDVMTMLSQFRLSRDVTRMIDSSLRHWAEFHALDTRALLILNDSYGPQLFQLATIVNVAEATLQSKPLNKGFDKLLQRYQLLSTNSKGSRMGHLEACWLNGNDLAAAGIPKGPAYKDLLNEVYVLQLDRKVKSREDALAWLKTKI